MNILKDSTRKRNYNYSDRENKNLIDSEKMRELKKWDVEDKINPIFSEILIGFGAPIAKTNITLQINKLIDHGETHGVIESDLGRISFLARSGIIAVWNKQNSPIRFLTDSVKGDFVREAFKTVDEHK